MEYFYHGIFTQYYVNMEITYNLFIFKISIIYQYVNFNV